MKKILFKCSLALLLITAALSFTKPTPFKGTLYTVCDENGEKVFIDYGFTSQQLAYLHRIKNTENRRLAYIERFSHVADTEEERYGIPREITLAQGIIESNAGASSLAHKHNNHFGIKGKGVVKRTHEFDNSVKYYTKASFREFATSWDCFRFRSKMFLNSSRYGDLVKYHRWEDWAQLLGPKTKDGYTQDIMEYLDQGGKLGDRKYRRLNKHRERAPKKVRMPDGSWDVNPDGRGYATSITYPYTLGVYVRRYRLDELIAL